MTVLGFLWLIFFGITYMSILDERLSKYGKPSIIIFTILTIIIVAINSLRYL